VSNRWLVEVSTLFYHGAVVTSNLLAPSTDAGASAPIRSRSLLAACLTHALHDGYTDGLYAFMPIWQAQFGLSYAALAVVRALYYGTMGGLQIPADRLLRHASPRAALILSTVVAAAGLLIMSLPFGFGALCVGLVVAGFGSSIQHPRASMLVSEIYGDQSQRPLGLYNLSGDLGKAVLPGLVALLLPILEWRPVLALMAVLGMALTLALILLAPSSRRAGAPVTKASFRDGSGSGFGILTAIGALDTATRMGYLLFLPFLIHARGGGYPAVGTALALLFIGGAFGKATCGWLAERLGAVGSVIATEAATAALITATLLTPLLPTMVVLPLLGAVLNGTSSVLYGVVPKLSKSDTGHAFAVFYTSVICSGGIAPIVYGAIADHSSRMVGTLSSAGTALVIIPLILQLRIHLGNAADDGLRDGAPTNPS
jgi:MFS family permease